jgi:hypothetical protein
MKALKKIHAEAKVLRSLYYFELVRMFGNIPLILKTIKYDDDYWNIHRQNQVKYIPR